MPKKAVEQAAPTTAQSAQADFLAQMGRVSSQMTSLYQLSSKRFYKDKKNKGQELSKDMKALEGGDITEENLATLYNGLGILAREAGNKKHFGALFRSKHDGIGRFGQKQVKRKEEAGTIFQELEERENGGEQGELPFVDPFDAIAGGEAYARAEENGTERILKDLVDRTNLTTRNVSKSDFEADQLTEEGKLAAYLGWAIRTSEDAGDVLGDAKSGSFEGLTTGLSQTLAKQFDNTRQFTPDYKNEDPEATPNEFEAVLVVDPPTDVYMDYNKLVSKATPILFGKRPDYEAILNRVMRQTAAYQEIVAKGQADAAALDGVSYDPDVDPNIILLKEQIYRSLTDGQGHSFIRMVAKEKGQPFSSYSFGFWPLDSTPGMGAVTVGQVMNPDPEADNASLIERRFSISYANYLRAATKIRGVVGSRRTYSFLGYNCTSFAADIAKEAGVAIGDRDSSEDIQTFRYRSARVDTPYSLAKFVRQANQERDLKGEASSREQGMDRDVAERVNKGLADLSFLESSDRSTLTAIGKIIEDELRPSMEENEEIKRDTRGYRKNKDQAPIARKSMEKYLSDQVKTTYLSNLQSNPLFERLCTTFEITDDREYVALRLFYDILTSINKRMDAIDKQVKGVKVSDAEAAGISETDLVTRVRKLKNLRRRELMQKTFGYSTSTEYLSSVVTKADALGNAILTLVKARNAAARDILDENIDIAKYFLKLQIDSPNNLRIGDQARNYNQAVLEGTLRKNPAFQMQLNALKSQGTYIYGFPYEQLLLPEIARWVAQETGGAGNLAAALGSDNRLQKLTDGYNETLLRRIRSLCSTPDALQEAFGEGLQIPKPRESVSATKEQQKVMGRFAVLDEKQQADMIATAQSALKDSILKPIYLYLFSQDAVAKHSVTQVMFCDRLTQRMTLENMASLSVVLSMRFQKGKGLLALLNRKGIKKPQIAVFLKNFFNEICKDEFAEILSRPIWAEDVNPEEKEFLAKTVMDCLLKSRIASSEEDFDIINA